MFQQQLCHTIVSIGVMLGISLAGRPVSAQDAGPGNVIQEVESGQFLTELVIAQENLWTGLQLAPVDPALRSQLDLADEEGIVVVSVDSDSPADEAGIQAHDVLLTVGGEPVQDEATLRERIGGTDGEAVSVVLLRGGKRLTVELTPRPRAWDLVTYVMGSQYRIGVRVAEVDESLRSQLGLSEGRGLVVTELIEESPAAKAGIELHDILLEFGGKPLRTTDDLTTQVQEVGDRAATMELIRKGERQSVRVTPEREQPLVSFVESVNFTPIDVLLPTIDGVVELVVEPSQDETAEAQLQQLIREMEVLTERMEALQQSLRSPADE